jgi:DNA-binding LacI/PurR family transcriptional regulator
VTRDSSGRPDKVTIYEVAQRAGVSIATVSHALNRPEKVRSTTRTRVLEIIDELQFVPKAAAVSQARKGVGRIGVLAPFTSYASYRTRLVGVLEEFAGEPVDVVIFDHSSVADSPSPLLGSLPTTGRLDGLLIMGVPLEDQMAERLLKRRLGIVLVDTTHTAFSSVNIDDEHGGHEVGRHLVARGHRQFAFISEAQRSTAYLSPGQLRLQGFTRALSEAGIDNDAVHWLITSNDVRGGREAVQDITALSKRPSAVFAHHDDLAAGLLSGLRNSGLRVPDDLAVVGYDGGELADALEMTTVRQPFAETGKIAASLLKASLSAQRVPVQHITLQGELIIGTTT